jgi:hypothetical protein
MFLSEVSNTKFNINNNNKNKLTPVDLNNFKIIKDDIVSSFVWDFTVQNNLSVEYFLIRTDGVSTLEVGNLAIREKFSRLNSDLIKFDSNQTKLDSNLVNYIRDTVIITQIDHDYTIIYTIKLRPILKILTVIHHTDALDHSGNTVIYPEQYKSYIAVVSKVDDTLTLNGNNWYDEYNVDDLEYCDKITKINIQGVLKRTIIEAGLTYEKDGINYYDHPQHFKDENLPEWCHA